MSDSTGESTGSPDRATLRMTPGQVWILRIKWYLISTLANLLLMIVVAVAINKTEVNILLDDLTGIAVGDKIYFKGMDIGSVESIRILSASRTEVKASITTSKIIDSTGKTLLFQDAVVLPMKLDAAGKRRLELDTGDLDGYPIWPGQAIVAFAGKGGASKSGGSSGGVRGWIKQKTGY